MSSVNQLIDYHQKRYNALPQFLVKAPGRINIIGEHTDYNNGYVLPTAIDRYIYFVISRREDNKFNIYAADLDKDHTFSLDHKPNVNGYAWYLHITGVIEEFRKKNHTPLTGLEITYGGDIPGGSGLSSSAAIEAGFATAINTIFNFALTKLDLAYVAQMTEHHHIEVQCGIMDMYASIFSEKDKVLLLDCNSLTHQFVPLDLKDCIFVLVNSGVKHNLADSAYNERRQQCEFGVAYFQTIDQSITSLRDVTFQMIESAKDFLDPIVWKRCKYVIEENQRVLDTVAYLSENNLEKVGALLYASHKGLSEDYEVSCKELDDLIDIVKELPYVLGARMMGGGFGGCTINLLPISKLNSFKKTVSEKYKFLYNFNPDIIEVNNAQGITIDSLIDLDTNKYTNQV